MKRPRRLSAAYVETVKRVGRYGDGRGGYGLSLLVKERVGGGLGKSWSQRIRIGGRVTNLGLGRFPVVMLSEARKKALANLRVVEQGDDPRGSGVPSFAQAAERVIRLHEPTWRNASTSAQVWRSSLERYVFPVMGDKAVSEVTSADVLRVLIPVWNEKRETARRLRGRISAVMKWSIAQRFRTDDPARDVDAVLPKNGAKPEHHKALPHADVAAAVAKVRASGASVSAKCAFELLVLTAARSGEVRHARWDEVDLEQATWLVPGERMKSGVDHAVPLSDRAVTVLAEALAVSDGSGLIFPSPARAGRPMTAEALIKLCSDLGIPCTPHGFRSSFRSWAAECTDAPREVCEAALAHVVRDATERAYFRTTLYRRRIELMGAWSAYLERSGTR